MKQFLVILGLVAIATTDRRAFGYEPITESYHENYGIPEATRIKALESALDFDGSRITEGSSSEVGQFPFLGRLLITVPQGISVCGSSLIGHTRLITAAHCWNDGRTQAIKLTVILGSVTLFTGGTRIDTNQVVMHPNWNPRTLANDIAVITVNYVPSSNNIRPIGLATGSNNFAGNTATAVSFGLKGDNQNIAPDQTLSHVALQVIPNFVCRLFFQVQASNICTSGANARSTCRGASGGPLAIDTTLIGITSFGFAAGCTRGFPAVYTRVSSFTSWINAQ